MSEESKGASARLPSLDGLRAVSALMVIAGHAGKLIHVGRHMPYGSGVVDVWGPVGVTVFFVLSGFLITRLLVDERRKTGTVNLRDFFLRRAFRILPAYWAYIAVIAGLASAGLVIADRSSFVRALSFTTDYLNPGSWVLNHSWSLSVEEQFYLFWPVLLLAVGLLRARRTALFLIVAAPVVRVLTFYFAPELRPSITAMLHLRIDAIMVGCWAALEMDVNPESRALNLMARPQAALFGAIYCVLIAAVTRRLGVAQSAAGYSLEAICACAVLLWAVRNPASSVGRVLNARPLAHLGVISYSLYLWQELWLSHETMTPLWMVPLLIAGTVLCGEVSYRLIEAPMLRLRRARVAGRLPASPADPAPSQS